MKLAILSLVFMVYAPSVRFLEGCKSQPSSTTTTTSTTTSSTTTTTTTTLPPTAVTFVTEPQTFVVKEDDDIMLPCKVDSLGTLQIIWKRGSQIIALGDKLYEDDDNIVEVENTENGSTIVIRQAEEKDAGEYVCEVSAAKHTPVQLKLTVKILVRPEVEPVPKSGLVTVKVGEPATFGCKITRGGPETYLNWETAEIGYPLFWFGDSQ